MSPRKQTTVSIAWLFVGAGLGIFFLVITAVVLITLLRPTADNVTLYVVIIGFGSATFSGIVAAIKGQEAKVAAHELSFQIDGRFTQLLKDLTEKAKREGQIEGAIATANALTGDGKSPQ